MEKSNRFQHDLSSKVPTLGHNAKLEVSSSELGIIFCGSQQQRRRGGDRSYDSSLYTTYIFYFVFVFLVEIRTVFADVFEIAMLFLFVV